MFVCLYVISVYNMNVYMHIKLIVPRPHCANTKETKSTSISRSRILLLQVVVAVARANSFKCTAIGHDLGPICGRDGGYRAYHIRRSYSQLCLLFKQLPQKQYICRNMHAHTYVMCICMSSCACVRVFISFLIFIGA